MRRFFAIFATVLLAGTAFPDGGSTEERIPREARKAGEEVSGFFMMLADVAEGDVSCAEIARALEDLDNPARLNVYRNRLEKAGKTLQTFPAEVVEAVNQRMMKDSRAASNLFEKRVKKCADTPEWDAIEASWGSIVAYAFDSEPSPKETEAAVRAATEAADAHYNKLIAALRHPTCPEVLKALEALDRSAWYAERKKVTARWRALPLVVRREAYARYEKVLEKRMNPVAEELAAKCEDDFKALVRILEQLMDKE
ncbi:MAG: hypothetical protein FWC40_08665 [Proteobacteria bacterium]|nr:hypothetical protein [Pseudomonadota bacterium]